MEAKGLGDICKVMDDEKLGAMDDESFDLVVGLMSLQFMADKPRALQEIMRVMKPGGVGIFNVWEDLNIMPIAGELMAAVAGPPDEGTPPLNPCGPLGLADKALFDELLTNAGFTLTENHNQVETFEATLGQLDSDEAFKSGWHEYTYVGCTCISTAVTDCGKHCVALSFWPAI